MKEYLESYRYNFNLTPINHQENYLASILEMANGEGIYIFSKKKDLFSKVFQNICKR